MAELLLPIILKFYYMKHLPWTKTYVLAIFKLQLNPLTTVDACLALGLDHLFWKGLL